MALAAGRWFTVVELVDKGGDVTSRRYEQSAPADYTAALASQTALTTDLAAVTNCVIRRAYTYQEYAEDAFDYPTTGERENQAVLTVGLEGYPTKSATLTIPAPIDSMFVGSTGPSYNVVKDPADSAELAAFLANFDSEALFYVSDGEQMDGFKSGHRRHVRSSKG